MDPDIDVLAERYLSCSRAFITHPDPQSRSEKYQATGRLTQAMRADGVRTFNYDHMVFLIDRSGALHAIPRH